MKGNIVYKIILLFLIFFIGCNSSEKEPTPRKIVIPLDLYDNFYKLPLEDQKEVYKNSFAGHTDCLRAIFSGRTMKIPEISPDFGLVFIFFNEVNTSTGFTSQLPIIVWPRNINEGDWLSLNLEGGDVVDLCFTFDKHPPIKMSYLGVDAEITILKEFWFDLKTNKMYKRRE